MSVSIIEKKEFLRWFLKNNQMKRRECVWVLNYMISHEKLLENVHFVEEAHYCPKAMIMSTTDSSGIPFRFYKGKAMTADAEKAFHDLRLRPEEDIYIQLNFNGKPHQSKEFLSVLEDNSYAPKIAEISVGDIKLINEVIENSMVSFNKNKLLEQIDIALDNRNKADFILLTNELNKRSVK